MGLLQRMLGVGDPPVIGADENWGGRLRRPQRVPPFYQDSTDITPPNSLPLPPETEEMPDSLTGMSDTQSDPVLGVNHDRMNTLRDKLDNPQPMSLKQKILRGVAMAAPVAVGAAMGGGEGALAAFGGEGPAIRQNQQNKRLDRAALDREYEAEANRVSHEETANRNIAASAPLRRAQTEAATANARARNAKADLNPSEKTQTVYDESGAGHVKQWNPNTQRYDIDVGGAKPVNQKDPLEGKTEFERDFYRENHRWPTLKDKMAADQSKNPTGAWTLHDDGRGNTVAFNTKTRAVQPVSGVRSPGTEPTADEKRRDDLARNVEENLNAYEDILQRRPELFGSLAGRGTKLRQFVGTNDPDVAKLKSIKEFMGMAAVGAHAMRNANHIEKAANSVLDEVNGVDAIRGNIKVARDSLHTFHQDASNPQTRGTSAPNEIHYHIENGQLVPDKPVKR